MKCFLDIKTLFNKIIYNNYLQSIKNYSVLVLVYLENKS